MATSQQSTTITVNVNANISFSSEMIYQLQQTISSNYDVVCTVIPNPTISKLLEVTSETADTETTNKIEGESTILFLQLLETAAQASKQ
jgi:hypothetical protein